MSNPESLFKKMVPSLGQFGTRVGSQINSASKHSSDFLMILAILALFITVVLGIHYYWTYVCITEPFEGKLIDEYGKINPAYVDDLTRVSGIVTYPNRAKVWGPYVEWPYDPKVDRLINIANNVCSKSCCGKNKYIPFGVQDPIYDVTKLADYVPSGISCTSNLSDVGCLCLPKEQDQYFIHRGNNA